MSSRGLANLAGSAVEVGLRLCRISLFGVLIFSPLTAQKPGVWEPVGPMGATVQAMAVDPSNPRRALAGTYFGGIYETKDGGRTWKHQDNDYGTYSIFSLQFDRRQNSVVYAGTLLGGVLKSLDGGVTWTPKNSGLSELVVQDLALDPKDSRRLMLVTGTGVYRSVDSGETWTRLDLAIAGVLPRCLAWDTSASNTVYLGTLGKGVLKSSDGGNTWSLFNTGIETESVNALTVADSRAGRLYVAGASGYVFKTSAQSGKWEKLSVWPLGARAAIMQLWAHPATVDVLVAGTLDGAYLSRDDGKTWNLIFDDTIGLVRSDGFGLTLYLAGIGGDLWMTRDLGKTVEMAMGGMQNVFVGSLAEERAGDNRSLFAGTEYGIFTKRPGKVQWDAPIFKRRVFTVEPHPRVDGAIYVGTEQYGVWRSTDDGNTWESRAHGMTPNSVYAIKMSRGSPEILYAGTSSGLYYSIDSGTTWDPSPLVTLSKVLTIETDPLASLGAYFGGFGGKVFRTFNAAQSLEDISFGLPEENITQLKVPLAARNTVYAVTVAGRIFVSQEFGTNWIEITPDEGKALAVEVDPGRPWMVYLGTQGQGVLKSETAGIDWKVSSEGMGPAYVLSLAVDPLNLDTVFAGTESALFRSKDGAGNWERLDGLPTGAVSRISIDPANSNRLYVAIEGQGVFRSMDGGEAWESMSNGLTTSSSTALAMDTRTEGRIYAGTDNHGVFVSTDYGETWKDSSAGMSVFVRGVAFDAVNDSVLYAGSLTAGFFRSDDAGENWVQKGLRDEVILNVRADTKRSGTVYVATTSGLQRSDDGGETWRFAGQRISFVFSMAVDPLDRNIVYLGGLGGALLKSLDGGRTWTRAGSGLPALNIVSLVINPDQGWLHAAFEDGPIYLSKDGGQTWSATVSEAGNQLRVGRLHYDPATKVYLAATSNRGVLLSFDGQVWVPFNTGLSSLAVGSVVGAPGKPGTMLISTGENGVMRSQDGSDWVETNEGLPGKRVLGLAVGGSSIIYALLPGAVYQSSDGGSTWKAAGEGLPSEEVSDISASPLDERVIVVTSGGGKVYLSNDGGASWRLSDVSGSDWPVRSVVFGAEGSLYAGTLGTGLIISRDNGSSWTAGATSEVVAPFVASIAIHPNDSSIVYAGTSGGVIRSNDRGESWQPALKGLPGGAVLVLKIDPSEPDTLYAGTTSGVYITQDGGANWRSIAEGMFHRNVTSISIDTQNPRIVYAGTEGGGVFRYVRP